MYYDFLVLLCAVGSFCHGMLMDLSKKTDCQQLGGQLYDGNFQSYLSSQSPNHKQLEAMTLIQTGMKRYWLGWRMSYQRSTIFIRWNNINKLLIHLREPLLQHSIMQHKNHQYDHPLNPNLQQKHYFIGHRRPITGPNEGSSTTSYNIAVSSSLKPSQATTLSSKVNQQPSAPTSSQQYGLVDEEWLAWSTSQQNTFRPILPSFSELPLTSNNRSDYGKVQQWLNTWGLRCAWCFFHNKASYSHSLASCVNFEVDISEFNTAISAIVLRNNTGCFVCLQPHSWCRWAVLGGARTAPHTSSRLNQAILPWACCELNTTSQTNYHQSTKPLLKTIQKHGIKQ
ncbi:hypothetical protein EV426DRAFT_249380 [Tirmania nivea]|nr:hypothetical protein EV426DRAFT_249380 [Tirmania nivea]